MPKDFYKLAPIEFDYALEDWQSEDRNKWERMRLNTFHLLNIHLKKQLKHVWELMPFDWDKIPEKIEFSDEYIERIKARDKKVFEILAKQKNGK